MLNKEDANVVKPPTVSTPRSFQGHLFLVEEENEKKWFLLLSLLNPPSYLRRPQRVMIE